MIQFSTSEMPNSALFCFRPYKTNIFKKSGDKIAVSYRNPIFDVSHSDDEGEIVKETAKSSTDTKSTAFSNPLYGQEVNIL